MPEDRKSDLVEIGALWIGETKTGEMYLNGKMGRAKLLVFRNKFKDTDRHPDYKVYVTNPERQDQDRAQPPADKFQQSMTSPQQDKKSDSHVPPDEDPYDEIPF